MVSGFGFGNFGILCVRLKKAWLATPLFENSASLRNTNPPSETNAVLTRNEGLTVPTEQKTVKYLGSSISHKMQRYHPLVT